LKDDESDSTEEHESKEDPHSIEDITSYYSPSDFCSNFSLSITDDDPRTVREAVDS
jgi:hypothetical protein